MDYWQDLDLRIHEDWQAFACSTDRPERLWLFTTKAKQAFWDVDFQEGDGLLFGNEGHGAPSWLHDRVGEAFRITIPHGNETLRSLNLATAVGIATFEALRQLRPS